MLGVGALGNGLVLMGSGWLVGSLLGDTVLAQFYLHPEHAVPIIALSTGSTGFMVGAMVLAVFNKFQRVRKDTAERPAEHPHTDIPLHYAPSLAEDLQVPLPSRSEAAHDLGCYTRASVEAFEGRYVCFRPAFSSADVINAYLMSIHWDETASREGRTTDQHDAFSVAEWLRRGYRDGTLADFLNPSLEPHERAIARIEGWILGVA